jgi:hypothetical protein
MNINKTQKGSALIIALLMMGVLMTLALGLSDLVIREVRINTDVINSGKAYFAAEAGIESALLDLHQRLPGYETEDNQWHEPDIGLSDFDPKPELFYTFSIANKTKVIPYVDTTIVSPAVAEGSPQKYLYDILELNDSVTIPLFTSNEDGTVNNVTEFRVEYFIHPDAEVAPKWSNYDFASIDILRWKITGLKKESLSEEGSLPKFLTESIGDYIAAYGGSNADSPSCFGTRSSAYPDPDEVGGISYDGVCTGFIYDYARNAYLLDADYVTGQIKTVTRHENLNDPDKHNPVFIEDFLKEEAHTHNYLTLTNIFNPSILSDPSKSRIYYRIIIPKEGEYTIRDYAKIEATGLIRGLRQQIEAFIAPDRFMPVFNFSLYRTDVRGDQDKETPTGYIE